MMTAQEIIDLLQLELLPHEGGYFRQTYQAAERIAPAALPARYHQPMALSTAIYFMLTPAVFSAMHRLPSDEVYHFYLGDPVEMLLLHPDGRGETFTLGTDLLSGMRPQKVVPPAVWQGLCLRPGGPHGFALIGTTMAPGFEWDGFELGDRAALLAGYPDFTEMIEARLR